MNLLLDIGNSSINWAIEDQHVFDKANWFVYEPDNFVEKIQEHISPALRLTRVLVANVAGEEILNRLYQVVDKVWQCDIWQAGVCAEYKQLQNGYDDFTSMGVDRWLAMVAAWEKHNTNLCVIDCGTALTIDFIESSGKHRGGYILPGNHLLQRSLIGGTTQIKVDVTDSFSAKPANNTQAAIANGACLALVSSIEHAIIDFKQAVSSPVTCVLTGGYTQRLSQHISYPHECDPQLVLRGLSLLHKDQT